MSNGAQESGDPAAERPQTAQHPRPVSHSQQAAKSPDELQRDIEHTREELGDTVDALSQKADVKAQAQEARRAKAKASRQARRAKAEGLRSRGLQRGRRRRRSARQIAGLPAGRAHEQ